MSNFDDSQNPVTDDFSTSIGMLFPESRSQALDMITNTFLENNTIDAYSNPKEITNQVISMAKKEFHTYNENAPKGAKMTVPVDLTPSMISKIMMHMYCIRNINCAGANSEEVYDILGIYQEDGPDKGIYISKEKQIENMICAFNPELTDPQIKQAVNILKRKAPRVERCSDPDLIAINNGIFNYQTKIVEPFDPEHVFTAKCRINYNPTATNVIIHNDQDNTDWDVESWIFNLFDDPEIAECIWQIMGAVIRPNIRWGKAAWFVSEKGNNGKGTLCHLLRNLVGEGSYAAIKLSDFGKEFMLEPLISATSIITDENDVGAFIDKAAELKAVITNDVIQINRKFKTPIAYQFKGFVIQCVNEMPRTKDKSESFYRRQLFIPFTKCYTGIERKYIKDDYLNRTEVLEYVLYRILNMNYYEIHEPESCKAALEEYKTFNDPIRSFIEDTLPRVSLGCLPPTLLYDMYKGWTKENNPSGSLVNKNLFLHELREKFDFSIYGWTYTTQFKRVRDRMNCSEPLLEEYECANWVTNLKSNDPFQRQHIANPPTTAQGLYKDNWTPIKVSASAIIL